MAIGEQIKKLRKQQHMTQKQLAEKAGIAEITIRQYEAEKYNPKINALNKLCIALDCKITDLIDEESKKYYRMFDNEKETESTPRFKQSESQILYLEPPSVDEDVAKQNAKVRKILSKHESGEKLSNEDIQILKDYNQRETVAWKQFKPFAQEQLEHLKRLQNAYGKLNTTGQEEATKRIEELAEIERYTKPDEPPQE